VTSRLCALLKYSQDKCLNNTKIATHKFYIIFVLKANHKLATFSYLEEKLPSKYDYPAKYNVFNLLEMKYGIQIIKFIPKNNV
jgi:hypothetical protein